MTPVLWAAAVLLIMAFFAFLLFTVYDYWGD